MSGCGRIQPLSNQDIWTKNFRYLRLLSSQFKIFLSRKGFNFCFYFTLFVSPQVKVCTPEGLDCVGEIRAEAESCLNNCEGLITGVMNKPVRHLNNNAVVNNLIDDYDSYKSSDYSKIYFFNSIKGCTLKNSRN